MDTFTLDVGRSWILHALGRNPLARSTDRVEAVIVLVVLTTALLLTSVAGAIGTAVHDTRARQYAQEALTRHTVAATAIEDSTLIIMGYDEAFRVQARWLVDGVEHVGSVDLAYETKAGDQLEVWVDDSGGQVEVPTPTWRATIDAVFAGAGAWLVAIICVTGSWVFVRSRLTRRRYRGWDREWTALVGDDGGRTGSQT